MSKREHRRFTAEQKLEVLREADLPGVPVSEVCRRHGLAPSVFCRWRVVAQGGSAVALKRDAQRTPRKDDAEVRHKAEVDRLRAVRNLTCLKLFFQAGGSLFRGSDEDVSSALILYLS